MRGRDVLGNFLPKLRPVSESPAERGDERFVAFAGFGARKLIQIVFGLSIAFAASSFFLSFFSFGGGALV